MKLAFNDTDGMSFCCLCNWALLCDKEEEVRRHILEHLAMYHGRLLVTVTERKQQRKMNSGEMPKLEFFGRRIANHDDLPEHVLRG
ncbi:MAG: hypothetical protein KGL39_00175 [Patescibacteria group bacterium]|nr:hypothetical protein [Patescibacteria group bacterium]